ncbi:uncharacterized protein G2W53_009492 [Senna tora]|uniref:Uncharacterized protein n=1 Tax=Senna tora TaxID=362788 RepID=A0A834WYH7_9FABA|nr:uncharacterized protein G2W53_009492 [Senna tora]
MASFQNLKTRGYEYPTQKSDTWLWDFPPKLSQEMFRIT